MTLSRGARRSRRDVRRTTTLYSVGQETRTMMQSCASVAKLRSGGPILPFGIAAIEHPPDARHLEPSSATCFHARRIREQSQALLLMTPGEGQGRRERRLLGRDATARSAAFVRVPRSSSCANRASRLFAPRTIAPAHCPSGALSFWNLRKRHANSIMPQRTRALPDLARPLSRRRPPLSSGEPVSPA